MAFVGDIAGGSLVTAFGIVMALLERAATGRGQVVDGAIVDGSALLNIPQLGELNAGMWGGRGKSLLSGSAPFYGVYECSDGGWFAVGAIEPKFYAEFLAALGLDSDDDPAPTGPAQFDPAGWPKLRQRVAEVFRTEPRAHWTEVFAGIEGCGTPILELDELVEDPHLRARGTVVERDGKVTAAPAPRLSATPGSLRPPPPVRGGDTASVLAEAGFSAQEITALAAERTVQLA
jgi:alpha-methylacyl-CoA racemase